MHKIQAEQAAAQQEARAYASLVLGVTHAMNQRTIEQRGFVDPCKTR